MNQSKLITKVLGGQGVGAKAAAERNKIIRKVAVLLFVITVCALFCVWSRVRIIQMGYEISALQTETSELQKRANHLSLEIERLKSPGHLQKVATEIMKMHPPSGSEIVFTKKAGNIEGPWNNGY